MLDYTSPLKRKKNQRCAAQQLTNSNLIFSLFFGKAEFKFWRLCFIRSQCFRVAGVTVSEGKTLGERKCKTFVFVFLRRIKKFKMERKKIFFYVPARKAPECACEVTFDSSGVSRWQQCR